MKLNRATICNSPFLNVYSYCTEDFCIVSNNILKKEEDFIKKQLDVKIIKTQINSSPLIGVYLVGVGNKIVVDKNSISEKEITVLEKEGIKLKFVNDYNALGNLISVNKNYGFASELLKDKTIQEINKFLKIEIEKKACVDVDVPGSAIYVNDSLFLVNPNIKKKEYDYIKQKFGVKGIPITLNYGDVFVGNDCIGNSKALLVGQTTSNIEMIKVDELVVDLK